MERIARDTAALIGLGRELRDDEITVLDGWAGAPRSGSFVLPFLGFLFIPWTTLMYVLVAPNGVNGLDYLWLGLAVAADIASYSAGGVYGRRRGVSTA